MEGGEEKKGTVLTRRRKKGWGALDRKAREVLQKARERAVQGGKTIDSSLTQEGEKKKNEILLAKKK